MKYIVLAALIAVATLLYHETYDSALVAGCCIKGDFE
jgi:hypothetical protein